MKTAIALSDLTDEDIRAIAEHERIPLMAAAEFGDYLIHRPDGEMCLKVIICDDIETARVHGDLMDALALKLALRRFIAEHPRCDEIRRSEFHFPDRRRI